MNEEPPVTPAPDSGATPPIGRIAALRGRVSALAQQGLVRSTGVLIGGTVGANLITALSLPVVTRLYTPVEMSVLAVFASLLQTLYASICLRFDVALSMPENDEDAINLLALGAFFAVVLSGVIALILLALPASAYDSFGHPELAELIWFLPPSLALAGIYSLMQLWYVRRKGFGPIARSRMVQAGSGAATQIALGLLRTGPFGLLLGYAINFSAGSILLGTRFLRGESALLRKVSARKMRMLFREYSRFPTYSAPEALAHAAAWQLPIVLIAAMAIGPEAGYLTLAMFVVQAPMSLLGNALSQVYLSEAPTRHRDGALGPFTVQVVGGLMRIGVGPLIALAIVSPFAFAFVFGSEWSRAGMLVVWLTPWFIAQLLTAPVSMALQVTNRQRTAFIVQFVGLALRLGLVVAVGTLSPRFISEAYAISGAIFYFGYLALLLHAVGARAGDIARELRKALLPIAAFCVLGVVGAVGVHWLDIVL